MTLLNYFLEKDQVIIFMDTLASETITLSPLIYVTKFFPLAHLDMVICGTGIHGLVMDWFIFLNSSLLAKDVDHVDEFTTGYLQEIAKKYNLNEKNTCTIYHFGVNYSNEYKGYAYRSTDNFSSEILPNPTLAYKPNSENLKSFLDSTNPLFEDVVFYQYKEDKKMEIEKKVGIGGDIIICHLINRQITIYKYLSFIDAYKIYQEMCSKLPK